MAPPYFGLRVLQAVKFVPAGRVTTYGEIARFLETRACRAVGTALKNNQDVPVVPCHRVVLRDGRIGGYSGPGGISAKIKLLKREGVSVKNGRVQGFTSAFFRFSENE